MTGCPYCPMLANTQAGHVSVDIADGPGDNLFGQEQVCPMHSDHLARFC